MNEILKILSNYRKKSAFRFFLKRFNELLIIFVAVFIITAIFENIFYIKSTLKEKIAIIYINLFFISLSYLLLRFIIHYFSFFNFKNYDAIAKEIGNTNKKIKDKLLNALQINNFKDKSNSDLKEYAIQTIYKQILKTDLINFSKKNKIEYTKLFLIIISSGLILLIPILNQPINRLINFGKDFEPPLPFTLESITKNKSILSNDDLKIELQAYGSTPDTIILNWYDNEILYKRRISNKKNKFTYTFDNVEKNFEYWANYENPNFFSKWEEIKTEKYLIDIKQRPKIVDLAFKIEPPEYTGLKNYTENYKNVNQIIIPNGSKVSISGQSDKLLNSAWLKTNEKRINLEIYEKSFNKKIFISDEIIFSLHCLDKELIPNLNPKQYTLTVKKDNPPNISVQKPLDEFEINEIMIIPINANIIDDYGIKNIFIEYQVLSEDFPEFNQNKKRQKINIIEENNKNYNLNFNWDINNIAISMGDELHFKILAIDNNEINGNQISESKLMIGKFPSLESLFSEIEDIESETQDIMDDINSSIEEISEMTENLKMEFLKSEEANWEQEKKIEDSFEEIEKISSQIDEIEKNIEEIIKKANENQLFDNQLIDKFEKFQNLIQEVMSQELFEAMQELQNALKNMDMNKISEALENYNFNMEQFEKQLDQYMEMFEMALAEQKLNELSEKIENMIKKQSEIINDFSNNQDEYVIDKKTSKQEGRFNEFNKSLDETSEIIKNISKNISNELLELSQSNINNETKELLNQQNQKISENISQNAKRNLNDIQDIMSDINQNFQEELSNELTEEFIKIIDNLLSMSNQQEKIISDSNGIKSRSPFLKDINRKQDNIDRQLNQITKQLTNLSNSTFFVNPKINRQIGGLKSSISKSISNIEQKQVTTAFKEHEKILKYINNITFLLLLSLEEMQSSESASGFEQFMKSLEKMSNQQQGINQMSMQLGQMGMMQQKSLIQELLKQQSELRQQLEDLIGDNPGEETGGLSNAGDEMDEVIIDFKNNNVNRKTLERQQRILSKMLDSQKSLTQKDYSKKRKSKTASNYELDSKNLNSELKIIENNKFYIDAMEAALQEDIPNDYQNITRLYFLNLQKNNNNE